MTILEKAAMAAAFCSVAGVFGGWIAAMIINRAARKRGRLP